MSERMTAAVKRARRINSSNAFRCFLSKSNYTTIYILSAAIALFTIATMLNYVCERQFRRLMFENRLHIQMLGIYRQSQGYVNQSISSTNNNSTEKSISSNQIYSVYTTTRIIQTRNKAKTQYPLTVNAPFLIENPELCSTVKTLSVLVIVHTAPKNFARREAIRNTWTNNSFYSDLGTVRTLFLLGTVKDQSVQQKIEEEFKIYSDILQGDFVDSYRNLSHKGVMAYKWITERCRNAKLILKVDDDVVVSMYAFFDEYFPLYKDKQKHILCNYIHPGTMLIIRKVKSKWYVDENQFKGEKFYPRYCSGFMVVFTNDVIPAIYRSASFTPFFWVDDVYLYGLVPGRVLGITYKGIRKHDHQLSAAEALKCYANITRTCDFLVTGAGNPAEMNKIWTIMGQKYKANKKAKLIPSTNATRPHVQMYDATTSSGVHLGNTKMKCYECDSHTRNSTSQLVNYTRNSSTQPVNHTSNSSEQPHKK